MAKIDVVTAERDALQQLVQVFQSQSPLGAPAGGAPTASPLAQQLALAQEALSKLKPATLAALPKNFVEKLVSGVEVPAEPLTEVGVRANVESVTEQARLGELQENLQRAQRASVNTGTEITVEQLLANDQRAETLRKRIEAGPLAEVELQQKLAEIRPLAEAEGKNIVEEITGLNSAKVESRNTEAMSKLVTAAGKSSSADLHETIRSEFIRTVEAGGSTESTVKEFAGRQRSIDVQTRTLFQEARGVLSGSLGKDKGIELLAQGKTAEGTKAIRGAKLKGRGIAGALAIPLLLALTRGGGDQDQPEELDLRQLFLQRQSQELAGSQAKLNSQLGLNEARRSKSQAQAEGELLRNLLLMQQISGGGANSLV